MKPKCLSTQSAYLPTYQCCLEQHTVSYQSNLITSKTPFGRWTSGSEHMCLNVCTAARTFVRTSPIPYKTHSKLSHNHTTFSTRRSRNAKKGCARAHVRLYHTLYFCKTPSNESLITSQISLLSFNPFPGYQKEFARAAVPHPYLMLKA